MYHTCLGAFPYKKDLKSQLIYNFFINKGLGTSYESYLLRGNMLYSVVLPVGWLFLLKEQGQVIQEVGLGLQHRLQGFLQCPVILPGARAPLRQDLHDLLVMGWMSLSIHLKHTVCILRKVYGLATVPENKEELERSF